MAEPFRFEQGRHVNLAVIIAFTRSFKQSARKRSFPAHGADSMKSGLAPGVASRSPLLLARAADFKGTNSQTVGISGAHQANVFRSRWTVGHAPRRRAMVSLSALGEAVCTPLFFP